LVKIVGVNPPRLNITLLYAAPVVTVTARQPVPSDGKPVVTGQVVTMPREAFAPDHVPFSVRLLQPLSVVIQTPPGVEVAVGVPVRV
jgi:hypothetical protein